MSEVDVLAELITQTLNASGQLGSIKAQLLKAVFDSVNEDSKDGVVPPGSSVKSSKAQPKVKDEKPRYVSSSASKQAAVAAANLSEKKTEGLSPVILAQKNEDGKLMLLLVKELLEYYDLDYSANVFENEANLLDPTDRDSLAQQTNTKKGEKKPLLVQLVESYISNAGVMKEEDSKAAAVKFSSHAGKHQKVEEYNDVNESIGDFDQLSDDEYAVDNKQLKKTGKASGGTQKGKIQEAAATAAKRNPMFSSMDETIGASASYGQDKSVESMDLEQGYDYYEDIQKHK